DEDGGKGVLGAGEEIDGTEAERCGRLRHDAVVAVEHIPPDEAGSDVGEDVGQEEDHAEADCAPAAGGGGRRQRPGEGELHEKRNRDDQAIVEKGASERLVGEKLHEVAEADELLWPAQAVPVEEAVPAGFSDRQDDEDGEESERRRQEDKDGRKPAPCVGATWTGKGLGNGHAVLGSSGASN